ncbi:hypothetical protein IEO21_04614 [Rhodonia placenta]|uniref:DNA polymerase V n=1 Tax=Rhodonia placenta TaxID=104341 RepID=A0A8H7P3W0_9APHY|nr:hypothetical protein IEO21_04614 [Postia placenta]
MSTTLPLFWDLSSTKKTARIEASIKLTGALEHFQAQFTPKPEGAQAETAARSGDGLDVLNAQDVSYSIRRLVRGLSSPRESSRLGFAVALTELLSRINTVTCAQIVALIVDSSKTQGSMTGQEERDAHFACLFGLTSVIQSGLLLRNTPLPTSASSSTLASSLSSFKDVLTHLFALGEKKSWLRESAWWAIGLAVDSLGSSDVAWKEEAVDAVFLALFSERKYWTPEKVALALKLQKRFPTRDWKKLLTPTFKHTDLLSTGNLTTIARILKEAASDEESKPDLSQTGMWKPQVHFVWDVLLDEVLSESNTGPDAKCSFPEFFRITVDESLFASTASPERKYWGFQIFRKALPRVASPDLPLLFTKNFMRSWINHLSNSDRYLHKIARQVATDIQSVVKNNSTLGFTLILQLTGGHGSRQFDRLTKTKTVETILTSMDTGGIESYINYLLEQINDESALADIQALNGRRAWILDQLSALIRNGAIPKSDGWVQLVLDWLVVHGLFVAKKKSDKSHIKALHRIPSPPFSDDLRKACRERLLSCLAELTGQLTVVKEDDNKTLKMPAVASDGEFWIERVLSTIDQLEKDTKHVSPLDDVDEEELELRQKSRQIAERLRSITDSRAESAKGARLLLSATLLHHYCSDEDVDSAVLEGATRMFPAVEKKNKKSKKSTSNAADNAESQAAEPVDVLVDNVIGFLEQATSYMRAVANQVFSLLSGAVQESTIDLILTQLERRDPTEGIADEEDEEMEDDEKSASESDDDDSGDASEENEDEDDEEVDEEEDAELRRKIEEALRVNGVEATDGNSEDESDEDLMDDDQMLAIDEQLAAVFRARANERKTGKDVDAQREATHFKNRVLDLVDTFLKKQPTSPLVAKTILPLVDLVVSTGSDEKQLADKASGILRSRIGKSKEAPVNLDKERAKEVLEELHSRARKTPSSDVLATFAQCSVYLSRALHHEGEEEAVLAAYRASLADFVTRKASKLNTGFFLEFVRRHADIAWDLRDDLTSIAGKAVNPYRQCQAFQVLHTLFMSLLVPASRKAEFVAFIPTLRRTLQDVISGACDASSAYQTPQVKDLFKLALAAIRLSKRVAPEELSKMWESSTWSALAAKLANSDRFRSAQGLQSTCKQITNLTANDIKAVDNTPAKRKANVLGEEEDQVATLKTAKRKKVKKSKIQAS